MAGCYQACGWRALGASTGDRSTCHGTHGTHALDVNLDSSVCFFEDPRPRKIGASLPESEPLLAVICTDSYKMLYNGCARLQHSTKQRKVVCVCACLLSTSPILCTSYHVDSHKQPSSSCALVGLAGALCRGAWPGVSHGFAGAESEEEQVRKFQV